MNDPRCGACGGKDEACRCFMWVAHLVEWAIRRKERAA